jgi:diguanylate cyclase (GGDEF)-like protein
MSPLGPDSVRRRAVPPALQVCTGTVKSPPLRPATDPVNPLDTQQIITDESAAARQLRAGFKWLRFEHDLEREFRRDHIRSRLPQIRENLYLAAVLVVLFGALDAIVLGPGPHTALYVVQFGLLLPIVGCAIAVAHLPNARRLYPRTVPLLAPIMGLLVIAVELKAAQAGVQIVFATVLLTGVYLYFLLGLLFYQALRANLIVLSAYVAFGIVGGVDQLHVLYNALALALASFIGGRVAYLLEMEIRTHFLEQRMLYEMAARDGLTSIYNRRRFDEHLETVWQQAQREGVTVALLLVDIDFFKRYNDRHGHQAGDECLRAVAAALTRAARRPLDFVARYGGEEFAVILYDPSRPYLQEIAHRVHANVAALGIPHGDSAVSPQVSVSAGIAYVAPTLERSTQGFVQLADEALYQAKNDGRNRSVFSENAYESLETGSFRSSRRAVSA